MLSSQRNLCAFAVKCKSRNKINIFIKRVTIYEYTKKMKLFDLINAETACSESTYAECAFGYKKDSFKHQGDAFDIINKTAGELNLELKSGPIHSGDVFYRAEKDKPAIVKKYKC